jgi:epoxyqueuosine reductase QueG
MLTMEMNKEIVATSPSDACNREIFRTYAALGNAVNRIADWLRERGYDCHPSPAIGGDINTVPTAQDANLGRIGKNGILITPEHGPCVRLAAVFVDVDDLPMAGANEHGWVEDFCETCNLCVEKCPGGAVHAEPFLLADGTRAYIEREKCAPAFSDGCSVCISCCPFTGGQYGRIHEAWLRQHEQAEGA